MEPKEAVAKYFGDMSYDPCTMKWSPSNPCAEIDMRNFRAISDTIMEGKTPFELTKETNMRAKNYNRDYDEDTVTVEVPGVPKDEIEVFIQNNFLYIKVREESPITYSLEDSMNGGELTVRSVKLDLGILTVVLDKSEKRKLLEIN